MSAGSLLSWGAPDWLQGLWALPLLALLLFWAQRRRRRALAALADAPALARLVAPDLDARRSWQAILSLFGLALLLVAAARPQLGFQWRDVERRGVDLALVLDVSRSMDAQDVSPSRMERARREVLDLCALVPADRIGLVVFAAGAYPRVPLTLDHDALLGILREVDTGTLQAQGSALPAALTEAAALLSGDAATDKAVLLISDGELPDDDEALEAAAKLGEAGIPIFALGVGTAEGAPIPLEGGGFKKDRQGQVVVSRLDEPLLRSLAARAGGAYVRSIASADDVGALVEQLHDQTEGALLGVHREKVPNEHFQWALGAGLVTFALGLLIALPGRTRATLLALCVLAGLPAGTARAGSRQDGLAALQGGDPAGAAALLMDEHLAHPEDMELCMTLGQALLAAGKPNEAERIWEQVAERSTDPRLRALARYDMGHAAYRGGRLTEAREHFLRAAEIDKDLAAAAKNAEAVAKEIAARTQDPEQPPQKPCDKPGQGGQGDPKEQEGDQEDQGQEDRGQQGDPKDQGQQDQEREGADGTREDRQDQAPMEGEIEPAGGSSEAEPQADQPAGEPVPAAGALSPEQAAQVLDDVREGSPRVVVPGRGDQGQDW